MNDVKLQESHPVDSNLRPLKIGGKSSSLELAQHGNGARINGDLLVTGAVPSDDTKLPITGGTLSGDLVMDTDKFITTSLISTPTGNLGIYDGSDVGIVLAASDNASIRLNSVAGSAADYFILNTSANGASYLQTVDAGGDAEGHLTLAPDGDTIIAGTNLNVDTAGSITLDSATGVFIAKKAGTEFSAANSAYAGMILGYTRLQGDLTSQNSFEIQDALTVEDDTHQITFKTPPSELVEIEATFLINRVSIDTMICVGISDQDAGDGYQSIGEQYEYDSVGISFSDDEADDGVCIVKWVLPADELATIGSSNTFWIGFSTGGYTKTAYIAYGLRASHGLAVHPFIIKATALPATIYDGQ